jgi:hypothetical protein
LKNGRHLADYPIITTFAMYVLEHVVAYIAKVNETLHAPDLIEAFWTNFEAMMIDILLQDKNLILPTVNVFVGFTDNLLHRQYVKHRLLGFDAVNIKFTDQYEPEVNDFYFSDVILDRLGINQLNNTERHCQPIIMPDNPSIEYINLIKQAMVKKAADKFFRDRD